MALALLLAAPAAAETKSAQLLVDGTSGEVLLAENGTQPWYPASLVKVMTGYMVFEAIADGRLALTDKVPVSDHAAAQPPTKLGLGRGKRVAVKLLLNAMIVRSANDAAVVLAEAVSGSEPAFAAAMTDKARALGMSQSSFTNATGLPDRLQVTTARDMVILARALLADYPEGFAMFGQTGFTLSKRTRPTTNGWMKGYPGADGIKSGFTCASGYNLLGSAVRDGRRLIAVILGARSSGARNARMTKLMNRGFDIKPPTAQAVRYLDQLPAAANGLSAPDVLAPGDCGAAAVIAGGHLPGWGLIFGAFASKAEAKAAVARSRKALQRAVPRGRPAIIAKGPESHKRYSALLVGLKQEDAGKACKQLRAAGLYCLALPPKQLNNRKALWR